MIQTGADASDVAATKRHDADASVLPEPGHHRNRTTVGFSSVYFSSACSEHVLVAQGDVALNLTGSRPSAGWPGGALDP